MHLRRLRILVLTFFVIAKSTLIFASQNHLRFAHITTEDGLSQNTINGIIQDKYGFMWFGTWEGVCRYDGYNFKVFRASTTNGTGLVNNRIGNLYLDSLKNIWVTDGFDHYSVYSYDQENFKTVNNDSIPDYISQGLNSRRNRNNGIEWTISNDGSELIRQGSEGEITSYRKDPFDDQTLSDYNLTDLYIDSVGVLWVGTENSGINKVDTKAKPFFNYRHTPAKKNSISENVIRAVNEDNRGNLWIGTFSEGITMIDKKGSFLHYKHEEVDANSLIDDRVRSLYCDKYGDVWIGTKGGLSKFSVSNRTFYSYSRYLESTIPNNSVFWITEDHDSVLWIATFNGFARLNREQNEFIAYNPDSLLNNSRVRCIVEDHKNQLWIGTEGGGISVLKRESGFKINGKLKKVIDYRFDANDSTSILSDVIHLMHEDRDGNMWIGTNNGLCRLNQQTGFVLRFSNEIRLPDDLIMGLIFDKADNVWVSHKKGLTKISLDEKDGVALRTYTKADGLQGNEFSHNAFKKSNIDGKFYFGGNNGLTWFYPDSIHDNLSPPKIALIRLKINNQDINIGQEIDETTILSKTIINTKSISIKHSMNRIGIEFVGLHYSNPQSNKYKYMLEGFDEDWISTDASHRLASYSNLSPGDYVFKAKAANCDGVWNPNPARLNITVLPPWWRTGWAYALYVFLVAGMLLLLVRFIVWRETLKQQLFLEKVQKERDQEMNRAKMEFYTLVSHELRTPLSLVVDPLEQMVSGNIHQKDRDKIQKMMLKNAKRLQQLLNQLLDFRKIESSKMEVKLREGDVVRYIHQVFSSFLNQANERKIDLIMEKDLPSIVCLFDADKMEKILSNIISNALKYTPSNGVVKVWVGLKKEYIHSNLVLSVSDTGLGIPDEDKEKIFDQFYQIKNSTPYFGNSSGLGLAMTRKLIELLGGTITLKDNQPRGSQVEVILPLTLNSDEIIASDIRDDLEVELQDKGNKENEKKEQQIILLVDDNNEIVEYLRNILSGKFRILTAIDGKIGLDVAIQEVPDVIISDVMMPKMDGMELCRRLKTDQRTSHIPIILLTAKSDDEAQIEGYDKGADIYHLKPFNSKLLVAQIESLLSNRSVFKEYLKSGNDNVRDINQIDPIEHEFINQVTQLIKENINNSQFGPDVLADLMAVSKRQLYRKIKALTSQTVHELITDIRMQKAKELLKTKSLTIAEIAFQVGYSEPSNFSRTFSKLFVESPSQFQKNN